MICERFFLSTKKAFVSPPAPVIAKKRDMKDTKNTKVVANTKNTTFLAPNPPNLYSLRESRFERAKGARGQFWAPQARSKFRVY